MNASHDSQAPRAQQAKDTGTSAILCRGLGKSYRIYDKPMHRLWDLMGVLRKPAREFWALRNVYLDIPPGSTVGIIGENGAGKSTLLKLLTGITQPTEGEVAVRGRVASLLELGAGFHPEFSGRDNIRLNCRVLGMNEDEVEQRFAGIVAFSELGDFIDRPVKTYSSGMYVRLGFAVAASLEPDVLLIDEALSVGDEHFRGKCINRLNQLRESGKTIVFVSHDIGAVKSMCQWVVLLDKGEVVGQGSAESVADEYLKRAHARGNVQMSALRGTSTYPHWGSGEIELTEVEMFGHGGKATLVFQPGEPFRIRLHYKASKDCVSPVFGVGLYRADGTYVNGVNHLWREKPIQFGSVRAGETGVVELEAPRLALLQGQYYLTTFLYDHSKAAPTAIDHREHVLTFQVVDARRLQHGLLYLPYRWRVERKSAEGTAEILESES